MLRTATISRSLSPLAKSLDAVALGAVGLTALALTTGIFGLLLWGALPLGLCAASLSVTLAALLLALRKLDDHELTLTALIGGGLFGVLNTYLCFALFSAGTGRIPFAQAPGLQLVVVTLVAVAVGLPLGMLFGAAFIVPLCSARRLASQRAGAAVSAMLRVTGSWLVAASTMAAALGLLQIFVLHHGHLTRAWPLLLGCGPALIAGLLALESDRRSKRGRRTAVAGRNSLSQSSSTSASMSSKSAKPKTNWGFRPQNLFRTMSRRFESTFALEIRGPPRPGESPVGGVV